LIRCKSIGVRLIPTGRVFPTFAPFTGGFHGAAAILAITQVGAPRLPVIRVQSVDLCGNLTCG